MKTVLAIDTSTSQTSVALIQDGKVLFNASHNDPLAWRGIAKVSFPSISSK